MYKYLACLSVHTWELHVLIGQKSLSESLELEIQIFESCYTGIGNQTLNPWKRSNSNWHINIEFLKSLLLNCLLNLHWLSSRQNISLSFVKSEKHHLENLTLPNVSEQNRLSFLFLRNPFIWPKTAVVCFQRLKQLAAHRGIIIGSKWWCPSVLFVPCDTHWLQPSRTSHTQYHVFPLVPRCCLLNPFFSVTQKPWWCHLSDTWLSQEPKEPPIFAGVPLPA